MLEVRERSLEVFACEFFHKGSRDGYSSRHPLGMRPEEEGVGRKKKMSSGRNERHQLLEKLGWVMPMNLIVDGHTASNAADLFWNSEV